MLNNMSFLYNQTSSSVKINFDTGNLFFIIYAYVFVISVCNNMHWYEVSEVVMPLLTCIYTTLCDQAYQ
jgi:hypothetical protein